MILVMTVSVTPSKAFLFTRIPVSRTLSVPLRRQLSVKPTNQRCGAATGGGVGWGRGRGGGGGDLLLHRFPDVKSRYPYLTLRSPKPRHLTGLLVWVQTIDDPSVKIPDVMSHSSVPITHTANNPNRLLPRVPY